MFLIPDELRHSPAPAITDAQTSQTWSYAAVADASRGIAEALRGAKSLVFLFCRNDAATVFAYLGAIEAGHAVAMLDESLVPEFKDRLIRLYEPEIVLSSADALHGTQSAEAYNPGQAGDPKLHIWRRRQQPDTPIHADLTLLLSTSGSTGSPKFVRLTRRNVERNARSIHEALGIYAGDRPITSLPVHYSYGLSVLNSHLAAGAETVLCHAALTTPEFWEAFRRHACTSWAGVPYSYQILRRLDLDKLNLPTLHTLTQAGGKLHTDLISQFHSKITSRGGRMFVMYGQTEATARISILPADALPSKLGSAGLAIPGGTLCIATADGIAQAPGITGEVVYQGPNVMMGYAGGRADLAAGDELKGVLRTGDTGHLDADGYLFLTGRRKRDAKVFGMRLNMDEVEDLVRVHGPAAVVSNSEKLVIFCEHGDAETFRVYAKELASKLRLHAGAFEFHRIDQLPLNANGKIDYSKLEQAG